MRPLASRLARSTGLSCWPCWREAPGRIWEGRGKQPLAKRSRVCGWVAWRSSCDVHALPVGQRWAFAPSSTASQYLSPCSQKCATRSHPLTCTHGPNSLKNKTTLPTESPKNARRSSSHCSTAFRTRGRSESRDGARETVKRHAVSWHRPGPQDLLKACQKTALRWLSNVLTSPSIKAWLTVLGATPSQSMVMPSWITRKRASLALHPSLATVSMIVAAASVVQVQGLFGLPSLCAAPRRVAYKAPHPSASFPI